ncbi:MAG: hypothetical protein RLZZ184_34 [Cyanobacteriota bacterium]|jgi:hypothetical protein
MNEFTPPPEELPPLESLMSSLSINQETAEQVIQGFVDNPPIPELANLPLAE